jgi:plastocyanin
MRHFTALAALSFLFAACTGSDAAPAPSGGNANASAAAAPSVPLTGEVIEVKMTSMPGKGEIFEPADFTARRGDIVRFVLVSGVHNAAFTPSLNPAGAKLPGASPYLQAPGQTWEFVVEQPNGEYYYQCDPHAAMGMIGHMTVVD